MPADLELIEHIDRKFQESRTERANTAKELHAEVRALRDENRTQHEQVVRRVTIIEGKLEGHLEDHEKSDSKSDGWVRLGAAGAIGGFSTWLAKYFSVGGASQ